MADVMLMDEVDDGKMDMEAHTQKTEQTKEIEALAMSQETFDAIENEFREFLNDHLKDKDLDKFRQEYQKINKALKTSYDGEKKLIKKCKEIISKIFENAQNSRAAMKMTGNEMEKINQLKKEKEQNQEEVQRVQQEEMLQREKMMMLKTELAELEKRKQLALDLEEIRVLNRLQSEFDELAKIKEEQQERIDNIRARNRELDGQKHKVEQ